MEYKNSVPRLLICLAFLPALANAECFIRSATASKLVDSIEQIADLERTVVPHGFGKNLCRISFRAYINGKWHFAQGEEIGGIKDSLDTICSQAMNAGRISILEHVSGTKITANQELICTDQKLPKDQPNVNVGDLVLESEVQIHPVYKDTFKFRGSICKWFIESRPNVGSIDLKQGVMCRAPEQKIFKIVDKW